MKQQKILWAALCCCLLALCAALGLAAHFRQESRTAAEQLAAAQERNQLLEGDLLRLHAQLAQAQADKTEAEQERDNTLRQYEYATKTDNPIDRYEYASGREWGGTTYEMSTNAAFFREAWKMELNHLVGQIKEEWQKNLNADEGVFVSDRVDEDWLANYDRELDRYQRAVEEQADAIVSMISLEWDVGYRGTAASISIPGSAHSVYRNGTLKLLYSFSEPQEWQKVYSYAFNDDTVTQLREELGDPLAERMPGRELFPPLSQVLPESP